MPLVNEKQFQMRVSPEFLERVDAWRRAQEDLPGRSEAIRRLVDIGLTLPKPKKGVVSVALGSKPLRRGT